MFELCMFLIKLYQNADVVLAIDRSAKEGSENHVYDCKSDPQPMRPNVWKYQNQCVLKVTTLQQLSVCLFFKNTSISFPSLFIRQ